MAAFGFGKKPRRRTAGRRDDPDARLEALMTDGTSSAEDLDELEERVARLTLTVRALWSLMREKNGLEEDDLRERMAALKLEAGETCPSCGRIMSRRHRRCLYCGVQGGPGSVMDDL